MDNFGFLCMLAVLFFGAIIAFAVLSRFLGFGRGRGGAYPPPGTYDDPDIRSGGSIGGVTRREYDSPDVRSGGSFGGAAPRGQAPPSRPARPARREYDDPDVKSGGSFGG